MADPIFVRGGGLCSTDDTDPSLSNLLLLPLLTATATLEQLQASISFMLCCSSICAVLCPSSPYTHCARIRGRAPRRPPFFPASFTFG
jgi:hypothetical protein